VKCYPSQVSSSSVDSIIISQRLDAIVEEFSFLGFALGVTCKSRPSTAARWVSRGQGCWSWVRSRGHEILSQVLTGLASARDVLPEEVTEPRTFE
jgi:hypothetical protein